MSRSSEVLAVWYPKDTKKIVEGWCIYYPGFYLGDNLQTSINKGCLGIDDTTMKCSATTMNFKQGKIVIPKGMCKTNQGFSPLTIVFTQ